jgi:alkaline phosphatase D
VTDTSRPRPVTTVDSGVFDTSQGTVHLVLGCGGSATGPAGHEDTGHENTGHENTGAGSSARLARVITRPDTPVPDPRVPGGYRRPDADAVEAATWSARRDTATGYGIAVFDVNPGSEAGGQTSITVRYYHAVGAEPAGAGLVGTGLVGTGAGTGGGTGGAPTDDYTLFETFTLVRPRSDGRRWHLKT